MSIVTVVACLAAFFVMNLFYLQMRDIVLGSEGLVEGFFLAPLERPGPFVGTLIFFGVGITTLAYACGNLWWSGNFFSDLSQGLWFYLPALGANQGAGLARRLDFPLAKRPVSVRWLGPSKTWAAYYMGVTLAIAMCYLQRVVVADYPSLATLSPVDYRDSSLWLVGGLAGIGATLFGDHAKSFFKRRLGMAPGALFLPFDQIDFVLGSAFVLLMANYSVGVGPTFAFMILMAGAIHPVGNFFGLLAGTRDKWL